MRRLAGAYRSGVETAKTENVLVLRVNAVIRAYAMRKLHKALIVVETQYFGVVGGLLQQAIDSV